MSCTKRVVDALNAEAGISNVERIAGVVPLTLMIRFDSQQTDPSRIGDVARQALESDPDNKGPVSVTVESEK
ncbi:MAG: hypothetical protein IT173_17370 [Acidobacteria bacterium]|nr:hypothetical protein [Acidobacteriota bacterium]